VRRSASVAQSILRSVTKTCKTCGETKSFGEFYEGKRSCKRCVIEAQLRRYHGNLERNREAGRVYYATHREQRMAYARAYRAKK
jgi:hypothetical protein